MRCLQNVPCVPVIFHMPMNRYSILSADWHLRDSVPACRTDDFVSKQWAKLQFIESVRASLGTDTTILMAGDLFEHWKPSPYLLNKAIQYMPQNMCVIYGNHDLPQHNIELAEYCGINVLVSAGAIILLENGSHWGANVPTPIEWDNERRIAVWHTMTYQGAVPYPGCTDTPARSILRKYQGFDLILTGHNHKPFVEEHNGSLLVNPGCITRQESDQKDFKPRIYVWDTIEHTVVPVFIPIERDVVTIPITTVAATERNNRIEAFISRLDTDWTTSINYEDNVHRAIESNPEIEEDTKQIILTAIEQ